jgi:hypothetical protein
MHVNDVRRLVGGRVFTNAAFGADAGLVPEDQREAAAQKLMSDVFAYAASRGMGVFFALDVDTGSANPQELIRTLPESARFEVSKKVNPKMSEFWLANPETPEGYAYYKAQIDSLLKVYPQITDLVLWFRQGGTPWVNMKVEVMPEAWQREYRAALAQKPEAAKYWQPQGMFALSKVVRVFERVLNEKYQGRVRLGVGTWGFKFLPACDLFLPADVKLVGLDSDWFGRGDSFETGSGREKLAEVGARRPLIAIAWAHHDDGHHIGRSYTPFADFADKLEAMKVQGFGVIHWNTRPLDLYFKSLGEQVWLATRNQPLRTTCDAVAERWFGHAARPVMGDYLERWVTDAPIFARETSDCFMDTKGEYAVTNTAGVIAGCKSRLKLIGKVDLAAMSPEQRDRVNYFKGLEEFIVSFYPCHQKLDRSVALLKTGDLAGARAALADARPETVIEQFAAFSSLGGITRGEQGLVVSMNTRWLTHFLRQKQSLGLKPIRYNFGTTSHDPLAQSAGTYTFYFDARGDIWHTFGEKEMKGKAFMVPENVRIERPAAMPEAYDEICRSGIESDQALAFKVRPNAHPSCLPAGDYTLRLVLADPFSKAAGERVFSVTLNRVAQGEIDIFKEAGRTGKIVERVYPVRLDKPGFVEVALTPVKGKVLANGVVLESNAD